MIDPNLIADLRVYPPLGIARVGNARGKDDYVIGPETIGGSPTLPSGDGKGQAAIYLKDFRTEKGEIKRQAARFRVYAHMHDGSVHEVTAASARIEWRVAIANLKAGWYEFNQAMDLPRGISKDALRRNRDLIGSKQRARLDITPTPRSIEGTNAGPVSFEDGAFWGKVVYLGELRTDSEGRLLFLGGRGESSAFRDHLDPLTFANNVGWHDDVSDGPVRATITFPGHSPMHAEPGYVAVTPPNYAPGLHGVVTMDDAVREVFQNEGWIAAPDTTSFTKDVWPIFDRLTGLQWVNHGLFMVHGFGSPLDARDPAAIGSMSDASSSNLAWRARILALFRNPDSLMTLEPSQVPQIYGDDVDDLLDKKNAPIDALGLVSVTRTQYAHLKRWASGEFASDWPGETPIPPQFSALAADQQVSQLERASLYDCLGAPFHPAMELTWVMRIPYIWYGPYRLKVLERDDPAQQDYGDALKPEICTGRGGPYDGVVAGALTRFLGVPWQTDHTSCNSGADYTPSAFLSMPTFWGARAPDQVLAWGDYLRAAALSASGTDMEAQISKHIMNRVDWLRDIRGFDYYHRLHNMVSEWADLGMVLPVHGAPKLASSEMRVEQGRLDSTQKPVVPIDVTADPKYRLVKLVEELGAADLSLATAAESVEAIPSPAARHPKRVYRQGEI